VSVTSNELRRMAKSMRADASKRQARVEPYEDLSDGQRISRAYDIGLAYGLDKAAMMLDRRATRLERAK